VTVYGISGGPIEQFREGWALLPFFGGHGKPHYWKRRGLEKVYDSLCGHTHQLHHPRVNPLEPGVFLVDRCKRCAKRHTQQVLA
jgi:hypothetical protein